MTRRATSNVAASVRQRLLNHAKERHEDFNFVLSRFAAERLLYRLSVSEHAETFVLKGALLFLLWTGHLYRPTRDVDLLGFGDSSIKRLEDIFRDICKAKVADDGLIFAADSVQGASSTLRAMFSFARCAAPLKDEKRHCLKRLQPR